MSNLSSAAADPAADSGDGAAPAVASATALAHDGKTEATAAASCWEIKQNDPNSADGTYWLQTPAMDAPGQFFCDQTTDGGGWVMIGRGREGWQTYNQGWGDQSLLLTRDRSGDNVDVAQLPTATVDGLLNNQPVSNLDEGYRVVRAANAQGTKWQTIDIKPTQAQGWVWPFKSYTTFRYRFDKGSWSSMETTMNKQLLVDCYWYGCTQSLDVRSRSTNNYETGWAYAKYSAKGSGAFIRQLGSEGDYMPFSEVYLRPQITSTDAGFTAIADSGTAAIPSRTDNAASEYAQKTSWGVSGNLTGSNAEGSIQVQAFAQVGNTMFVGGNFTGVRQGSAGEVHTTRALAAFDANTGEWNSSLTFDFDNQVHDLMALPNGKLLVAGDFTTVNGSAHSGTAVIDPTTGAVDESWDLQVVNRLSSGTLTVKTLATDGTYIYLGGAFTHLSGQGVSNSYGRAAARVSATGRPDRSWNPEFNGSVWGSAADAASGKYFAGGYFSKSQSTGVQWAASISTNAGAAVDTSFHFVSSVTTNYYKYRYPKKSYQQAVNVAGGNVYFGGSEHNLFGYDITTMTRRSGSITLVNGGDIQAIESRNNVTYASCHCSDFAYQDAYSWDDLPGQAWTASDPITWVGAWDSTTGKQLDWTPYRLSSTRSTGAWALKVTDSGVLWTGGDFNSSYTSTTSRQWNGGFALYGPRDNTPTEAPSLLRVTGSTTDSVNLAWNPVSGATKYEVLLDDRTVATTTSTSVTVPRAGNQRYFVRAVDGNGNISASSAVVTASNSGAPDASNPVLLEDTGTWSYLSSATVPAEDWASSGYDDSDWSTGSAPIGYGDSALNTKITPTSAAKRPITTYFRSSFTVSDASATGGVSVSYVADDGAVVYVNGVEVSRTRIGAGAVRADTRANAIVRTSAARADRSVVNVPASVLVDGKNTIAVETHVNYRASSSMTMQAMVTRIDGPAAAAENQAVADAPTTDPASGESTDPTAAKPTEPAVGESTEPADPAAGESLKPIDATTATGEVIPAASEWSYRYEATAADDGWNKDADLGEWKTGKGPIGWDNRNSTINTPLKKGVAKTAYFSRDIDLGTVRDTTKLTLKVRADDGAVVYVNGTEVGRLRMYSVDTDNDGKPENMIKFTDSATQVVTTAEAVKDENMLTIELDSSKLTSGVNRISVETHANYRTTPSLTFDATATLER